MYLTTIAAIAAQGLVAELGGAILILASIAQLLIVGLLIFAVVRMITERRTKSLIMVASVSGVVCALALLLFLLVSTGIIPPPPPA